MNMEQHGLNILQPNNSQLQILLGDVPDNLGDLIREVISVNLNLNVEVIASDNVDKLLEHVHNSKFDMFIPILNNIHGFPSESLSSGFRIDNVFQLVTHFKTEHNKPIIALSGLPDYAEKEAKQAGADLYFSLPFSPIEFCDAIRNLIESILNSYSKEEMKSPIVYNEGFSLHWNEEGIEIKVIDYQAKSLKLSWEMLQDLMKQTNISY